MVMLFLSLLSSTRACDNKVHRAGSQLNRIQSCSAALAAKNRQLVMNILCLPSIGHHPITFMTTFISWGSVSITMTIYDSQFVIVTCSRLALVFASGVADLDSR